MILVTPVATRYLRDLIKHHRGPAGTALRLSTNGKGGITPMMAAPRASDIIIEDEGTPILLVEHGLASALDGLVLDWLVSTDQDHPQGGFSFRAPTTSECDQMTAPVPEVQY